MKAKIMFVNLFLVFAGIVNLSSCTTVPDPTFGTLTITVYNSITDEIIQGEQIFLATSLSNLKQGIYLKNAWTNEKGMVFFGELAPGYYFFDAENWEDYGASNIYAGVDYNVHLYVNSTAQIDN